jgi:hypothetical protein
MDAVHHRTPPFAVDAPLQFVLREDVAIALDCGNAIQDRAE